MGLGIPQLKKHHILVVRVCRIFRLGVESTNHMIQVTKILTQVTREEMLQWMGLDGRDLREDSPENTFQ
jgi:hypothetical protein